MRGWMAVVLAAGLCACQADGRDRRRVTDVTARDYLAPSLPRAKVVLQDAFGVRQVVEVEVAATEDSRTRGMMWREALAPGQGMLFIFPEEELRSFWMRNTLIPLDMIFIASDGKVVGVVHRAEPKTLKSRAVGAPSRFVLEVPGGWAEQQGVVEGSKVELHGVGSIEVR